jgi:putative hydrolase of the HAD superfamily
MFVMIKVVSSKKGRRWQMVKAITFDCWDTILDDDPSRGKKRKEYFIRIFNDIGFPTGEDEVNELFSREAKIFQDYIIEHRKTPDSNMRVKTIVQLANVQITPSEMDKAATYCDRVALEYRPPVVPGIKEVLEELTDIYKLAIICNTGWHSGETVRQLLEGYDFPKFFSHLTFSDGAGIAKPHKQIFEYTLDKLGFRTEDAVHIGDSEYSDIVGAKEANMKAILFTGINDKYKDNNSADVTINNYDNLVDIIGKL